MNCEKLFNCIDMLKDEYVEFWKEFCDIESPTTDRDAVNAAGNYIVEKAKTHGWKIERFEPPVSGDVVVITMNPEADAAPIFFSGHLDTVHPKGLFQYRFSPLSPLQYRYIPARVHPVYRPYS